MANSNSEFVNWTLLVYVCNLANAGDLVAVRRVFLRECRPTLLAPRSYGAAFLLCAIPSFGKRLWRRHLRKAGYLNASSESLGLDDCRTAVRGAAYQSDEAR